jgi:transposase
MLEHGNSVRGRADVAGQLLVTAGDNPQRLHSEAAFAMLCGAAPLPASSGRTHRHRLNRGGDRQANAALYRIVLCRLRWDLRTRAYALRRTTEGMSKPRRARTRPPARRAAVTNGSSTAFSFWALSEDRSISYSRPFRAKATVPEAPEPSRSSVKLVMTCRAN